MKTVVHLTTELSTGGAQNALYKLLASWDRQCWQITVLCLYNGDGAIAEQIRGLGIEVVDLRMTHKWRLDALWRLYRRLRSLRPDILHSWMFHANILGRFVGRLAGVQAVVSSERTMGQESRFRLRLNRSTAGLCKAIICVSEQVRIYAEHDIGLPSEKLIVIPNGIDLDSFSDLPSLDEARGRLDLNDEDFVIGAIGRPRPVKGYPYLLDAFAILASEHPTLQLLFIGDGPQQPALIEQAAQLGISQRTSFLGDRQDIPTLLPAIDLLVSPSLWEGMSNVLLEAMAAGLPVVATAVGGTPDVVVDGETGLLTPSADSSSLAAAIESLITDPDRRRQMGAAGRLRVEQLFAVGQMVEKTQALYGRLLDDNPGGTI